MTDTMTKACAACLTTIDASATRCSSCTQRQPDTSLSRDVQGRVLGGVCAALAAPAGLVGRVSCRSVALGFRRVVAWKQAFSSKN